MSVSLELNDAINYSVKQSSHPSYRMSRVLPQSNASETLASGANITTQIELPNKVYNLSRSTLDFRMDVVGTASEFSRTWSLGAPIESFVLSSREGVELARVDSADIYGAAVLPYVTKLEDFLSHPKSLGANDATLATAQSLAETTQDKGFNFFPNGAALASNDNPAVDCGRNPVRVVAGAGAINDVAYTEMQYFRQGGDDDDVCINFSIPFSKIAPHTVCSMDKDFFFGQNLLLNVNWVSKQQAGWEGSSATVIETGEAVITGDITVNNIRVYLAVETNEVIANMIKQRAATEGLKLMVPFVRAYTYVSPVSTGSTMNQKVNLSNGQRLLHCYSVCLHNTSTLSTRHDKSNLVQIKVQSYQNQIDSMNLSENRIDEQNGEGYQNHRDLIKGSCIQNANVYAHNRVNILSFRDGPTCEWLERDGVMDGLDLSQEKYISIDQTTVSAAYRNMLFVVTQKLLNVQPSGMISLQ